jgi:putative CRISPR-associated protein (TIGR02619 family)
MKRTIITTVGTSLLTNPGRPWAGWKNKQPLPDANTVDEWFLEADSVKASAETHTWFRLDLFDRCGDVDTEVVLVHSHTEEGGFCAERLVIRAETGGLKARSRQVDGLIYQNAQNFNRGLRQLARVIGQEIKQGRAAGTVDLAATGGFKAEIAIANLVGAVSDTPVHYIYQEFSSIITLEPIPVTLRPEWIGSGAGRALLQEFRSADDLIPVSEVIKSLLKQDERLWTLVEIEGDVAALTFLGELAAQVLEQPQDTWPTTTDIAPETKKRLDSAAHHRPRGWEQIVDTFAKSRYVTSIRYEGAAAGGRVKEAPDNDTDLIHVIDGTPPLTLRIGTTATTPGERRLVQRLLRKELRV